MCISRFRDEIGAEKDREAPKRDWVSVCQNIITETPLSRKAFRPEQGRGDRRKLMLRLSDIDGYIMYK